MEGFTRVWDEQLWLHKEAAAITSTQDGSVATVAKTHTTGPGAFAPGTCLRINVAAADGTSADETYVLDFKAQLAGGGYQTFATLAIPRGTADQMFELPVTNVWWTGVPYDQVKVTLTLGGTTPSLDCTVMLCVVRM